MDSHNAMITYGTMLIAMGPNMICQLKDKIRSQELDRTHMTTALLNPWYLDCLN